MPGVKLTDLRMRRPTLEDVYLELVGAGSSRETRGGDGVSPLHGTLALFRAS